MTDLLHHLRPSTLAQMAAELVMDHAENVGHNDEFAFIFHTEAAKDAYSDILTAGFAQVGETEFFSLLEAALSRAWDDLNDRLFH